MADDGAPSSSTALPQDDLAVSISVVSPSVSVNSPINFSNVPPSTTIGQIKQKIRDALDSKPSNENQRLIHQGKLLPREQDTLMDTFGMQRLRDSAQLVLHLVIREPRSTDHHPSPSSTAAARGQSPARNAIPGLANPFGANPQTSPHINPHAHHGFQPSRLSRPAMTPGYTPSPLHGPQFGMPAPQAGQMPAQFAGPIQAQIMAQQHEFLHNYMSHRTHRPGAAPGQPPMPGMAHGGQGQPGSPSPVGNMPQGSNSPHLVAQPHTFVQQGTGPNGETHRVTVSSTFIGPNAPIPLPLPPGMLPGNMNPPAHPNQPAAAGQLSSHDLHDILRNADASEQASHIWGNAMQRSASGASLPTAPSHRQPVQAPGVTIPRRSISAAPLSRTATPDATRTTSFGGTAATQDQGPGSSPATQPEVYILNSPQGPRALLINGPSDLYYSPAPRLPVHSLFPGHPWLIPTFHSRPGPGVDAGRPHVQPTSAPPQANPQAPQPSNVRVGANQGPLQPPGQHHQQQIRIQPLAPGAAALHPVNPEGGVAGAVVAALWPHIWLLVRLTMFVWWFTSVETSWTRWFTVIFIALAIFIVNTGFLNQIANDVLNPFRQHMEGLIPFGALEENRNRRENPPAANGNAQPGEGRNNAPAAAAGRQQGEPDPAEAAARLVARRRVENGNWVLSQIRRLERAGLLFLASIAPGVAERHIANMEATDRAERERQEAADRAEMQRLEEHERALSRNVTTENVGVEGASGEEPNDTAVASGFAAPEQQQQQPGVAI